MPRQAGQATRLARALGLARDLHRDQIRRKTGAPTLSHLLAVASLVLENGGDEDEAVAALLHDGPEDCAGPQTLEEIRRQFGARVAAIVAGCTDSLEQPPPPWRARKQQYLAKLATADDSTLLVSLADKVHNVRSLAVAYRSAGEGLWQRFSTSREELLWYYEALLLAFEDRPASQRAALVRELAIALDDLRRACAGGHRDRRSDLNPSDGTVGGSG